MKLSDLKENPENPRIIDEDRLRFLEENLKKYGPLDGFIFNRQSERIVSGNHRHRVLPQDAEIELTEKYQTPLDDGTVAIGHVKVGPQRFFYREVEWDSVTEKTAMVIANQHAASWEAKGYADVLLDLDHNNVDLEQATMLTQDEIAAIIAPTYGDLDEQIVNSSLQNEAQVETIVCPYCEKDITDAIKEKAQA